ncbi:MAG: PilT/PilU family type 4a pilus ATPase [Armatimonadota bacterium]|nr:PilT/PilU family type 4a pilus ATPase [Armatimonadota bacterium]MDR7613137.1 PilT/PilU family type 4a pilus ATPase [Armatimonadota bacterium]
MAATQLSVIDTVLERAVALGASDVHLRCDAPVALRVAGNMVRLDTVVVEEDALLDLVEQLVGRGPFVEFLNRHEVDGSAQAANALWRVHAYWCGGMPAVALRRLQDSVPSMDELGVPEVVRTWAARRSGLLLVSGPTGAGKTTTLASVIRHITETRACHIVTIEDPIEYRYEPRMATVTQRQVGRDTRNFASALHAVVREDPDVILIGEMRDPESMQAALSIAEAGHLVLATLHTSSALEVPSRIVDALPASDQAQARVQLAATLIGIVTQILLPRAGVSDQYDHLTPLRTRVAAFEVLAGTAGARALIRNGNYHQLASQIQIDAEHGSMPMEESLARLVVQGTVEEEVAKAAALRPQEFQERLLRLRRTINLPSG